MQTTGLLKGFVALYLPDIMFCCHKFPHNIVSKRIKLYYFKVIVIEKNPGVCEDSRPPGTVTGLMVKPGDLVHLMEGGRDGGREGGREGGRDVGREGGKDGSREVGWELGREGCLVSLVEGASEGGR